MGTHNEHNGDHYDRACGPDFEQALREDGKGSHRRTRQDQHRKADGRGRGVSLQFAFGSYLAQVAEVEVSKEGNVRVRRVVCAVDCGTVVNPDTVQAQIQSGIIFGATAALHGEITLKNGRVEQTNFDTYQVLRIDEVPEIEVHLVRSVEPPGGMGETGTSAIVPAIANAIFAATGKRLRKMPVDTAALKKTA